MPLILHREEVSRETCFAMRTWKLSVEHTIKSLLACSTQKRDIASNNVGCIKALGLVVSIRYELR